MKLLGMAFVMATKNILLAIADTQTVADINEALGNEWLTTPVASEADALALLEAGSFDALVADFNLGDSDASELLNPRQTHRVRGPQEPDRGGLQRCQH